ncbi:tetratricopeptide repeat protein [Streptomyces sp. NPDC096040]|uniref:tetratricopeptide repeat protein n=1 Tax=Streptomyces sp. NPDC096040 TaxID=3155541 RepID=UPI00332B400E
MESDQPVPAGGVLAGMGGVGKTQLAAAHARTAWDTGELDVLVWVTASTRSAIVAGYAQAAAELLAADANNSETAAAEFLAWLEPKPGRQRCRWLVVLDDIGDPSDMKGLWPPTSPTGFTLATTRRRDAALTGNGRQLVRIALFTPDQALSYLTRALADNNRTEPEAQLTALSNDLGHLPLALSQAAAYLIDSGETVAAYRELLADRTTKLAEAAPDVLPDEQALPLAAAWSLSIDRADTLRPVGLARPMLQLTAFLSANGIPKNVLTSSAALTHLAMHRTHPSPDPAGEPAPVSARDAMRALRALHRLSLIDHTPDTPDQTVHVHQLIQRTIRDTLTPNQYDQAARSAADALLRVWPAIERDTVLAQTLRTNAQALARHAEQVLYWPSAHTLLFRTGDSFGETGQTAAARDHFRHFADTAVRHLGADHPDTLSARGNLARWRGQAGDPAGAAAAFAEILEDTVRVLGEDHPSTLVTRGNFAFMRGEAGDPAGAATTLAELLKDMVCVLGEDHPNTHATRGNFASMQGEAGDPAGAATTLAELLKDMVRVHGEDHPNTLATRNNLASMQGEAGDPAGAATTMAELLTDRIRVLGKDHPSTLTARSNLAQWQGEAGDPAGAATTMAELLTDRIRVLGKDHPSTLTTRGNLARWRGEAGDPAGAATTLAELLKDMVRVHGEDHPNTLATRNNLAFMRGEAGDPAGAATTMAELLTDRIRVLGKDHPDTLATRNNLASIQGKAGDPAGAATTLAELLKDMVRVHGEDHPNTLATRNNLASMQGEAGDPAGAATTMAELLKDTVRVLGENHYLTHAALNNLAQWRREAAKAATAYVELSTHVVQVVSHEKWF